MVGSGLIDYEKDQVFAVEVIIMSLKKTDFGKNLTMPTAFIEPDLNLVYLIHICHYERSLSCIIPLRQ